MFTLKKHIALLLLLLLLAPTLVKASHDFFGDHEHITCTSKTEQHLHELEGNCDDFHLQLEKNYFNLESNYQLFTIKYFVKKAVKKSKQFNSIFSSHKSSRAPPSLL
ncbi:hypothetical protein [Tenacibaculum aestuariivivum]|uniref:hypothetical protein n=1 Tax=Tenacibaculum aestuariivivum TaxID=2006131 RepID=UPI003AB11A90